MKILYCTICLLFFTFFIGMAQPIITLTKSANTPSITSTITPNYFQYLVNYSVVGGNATTMVIRDTLPYGVYYSPIGAQANVTSIVRTYTPDPFRRQIVTINMASPINAGTSGQVQINCYYRHGFTPPTYNTKNKAWATASNTTAVVSSNEYAHTGIGPALNPRLFKVSSGNTLDNIIKYRIYFDDNHHLKTTHIIDSLPPGAEFISASSYDVSHNTILNTDVNNYTVTTGPGGTTIINYDITGNDYGSGAQFSASPDFSQIYVTKNGQSPSATSFGIEILVRYPSTVFGENQVVTNKATLVGNYVTSGSPVTMNVSNSLTLVAPDCSGPALYTSMGSRGGSITGPIDTLLIGDSTQYTLRVYNGKNVDYTNVEYEVDLSNPDLDLRYVALDIPQNPDGDTLTFSYQIDGINTWIVEGQHSINMGKTDTVLKIDDLIGPLSKVTRMKFHFSKIDIGAVYHTTFFVAVDANASVGRHTFDPLLKYDCSGGTINKPFELVYDLVNDSKLMSIIADMGKTGTNGGQIGDVFTYTLTMGVGDITRNTGTLHDGVLADLLPANLIYLNTTATRYRLMTPANTVFEIPLGSALGPLVTPIPPTTVTNNYMGTGRQLLVWDLSNTNFHLYDTVAIVITFQAKVGPGTPFPGISNAATILSKNQTDEVYGFVTTTRKIVADTFDFDGDGNTTETGVAGLKSSSIVAIPGLASRKTTRGSMDADYTTLGNTVSGGIANYKLVITNTGSVGMKNITLIDVLPYVGDKNLLSQNPKGSQWSPFLADAVSVPPGVTVYYSTVEDINATDLGAVGGPNNPNWSTSLPSPITDVKAIKFEYAHNYPTNVLVAGDSLVITWPMRVPSGVSVGTYAYNSFAYKATRVDTNEDLLPSEPNKVAILIQPPQPNCIGNYVWNDIWRDGIQNETAADGINGVRVELYMSSDNIAGNSDDIPATDNFGNDVSFTVTGNNANNDPGFYEFCNLPNGSYYLKFALPNGYIYTPFHATADAQADSDANPMTGFSPVYALANNNTIEQSADAGFSTPCTFGVDATTVCHNNNTSGVTSDDWFSIAMIASPANNSGSYYAKIGAYISPAFTNGSTITIVGNGIAGNPLLQANGTSTYVVRIVDSIDQNCFEDITVGPVGSCSQCGSPQCGGIQVTKN